MCLRTDKVVGGEVKLNCVARLEISENMFKNTGA